LTHSIACRVLDGAPLRGDRPAVGFIAFAHPPHHARVQIAFQTAPHGALSGHRQAMLLGQAHHALMATRQRRFFRAAKVALERRPDHMVDVGFHASATAARRQRRQPIRTVQPPNALEILHARRAHGIDARRLGNRHGPRTALGLPVAPQRGRCAGSVPPRPSSSRSVQRTSARRPRQASLAPVAALPRSAHGVPAQAGPQPAGWHGILPAAPAGARASEGALGINRLAPAIIARGG
jgi:hypothetical protein